MYFDYTNYITYTLMAKYKMKWWNEGVAYMIYPSSYLDSNNDGIGDLKGIISKVPYLDELGIKILYLCPIFSSPMKDGGYDVDDYYRINPSFGDMNDLKELINELHNRKMRLILDLPLNHVSSNHPLFKEALEKEDSPARDNFYFLKGKYQDNKLLPPNNWASFFGGSAWERVGESEYFYLHIFSKDQPDIRWDKKDVRKKLADVANYYISLGVDGFRLDAVSHFAKDPSFSDSSITPSKDGYVMDTSKFSNRAELYSYLDDFRSYLPKDKDILLVGEAGGELQPDAALKLVKREKGPLNMVFNFDTMNNNGSYESFDKEDKDIKTDVISLKENFMRWYNAYNGEGDLPIYWENHDGPRVLSQYGSTKYRDESAKMLLNTLLFLYGTPFIQYGDEIGMSNLSLRRIEDFFLDQSVSSEVESWRKEGHTDKEILRYLNRSSRLSSRSVMQWSKDKYSSFSDTKPLYPLNDNYLDEVNISSQMSNPYSILNFFQYAIKYRSEKKINDLVVNSPLRIIDPRHPDVFSYIHEGDMKLMVISNMRDYDVYFSFYFDILDIKLHNYGDILLTDHVFKLRPFETYLLIVK